MVRGPGPGTGLPWNSRSAEGLSPPPWVQKRGSGWLAAGKGPGSCRSELGGNGRAAQTPASSPAAGLPSCRRWGRVTQGQTLPLQRRPPTAPLCMGSPPGGERMMGAPCPRIGARTSPALVSPGGGGLGPGCLLGRGGKPGGGAGGSGGADGAACGPEPASLPPQSGPRTWLSRTVISRGRRPASGPPRSLRSTPSGGNPATSRSPPRRCPRRGPQRRRRRRRPRGRRSPAGAGRPPCRATPASPSSSTTAAPAS